MKEPSSSLLITIEDLVRLAKKKRRFLFRSIFLAAGVGLVFSLIKPVQYRAQAPFLEGAVQSQLFSFSSVMSNYFGNRQESSAQFLLQTESILRHVVETTGFQVRVDTDLTPGLFRNVVDNVGYGLIGRLSRAERFAFSDVHYDGLVAKSLYFQVDREGRIQIFDEKKQPLTVARIGDEIDASDFRLTLKNLPTNVAFGRYYKMTLSPWPAAVFKLKKSLEIRPDRKDRSILWLSFKHRDADRAAEIVNQLAGSFLHYLKNEDQKLAEAQIVLLDERRKQLEGDFDQALSKHVDCLKENVANSGFIEVQQQIELLEKPQQDLQSRLADLKTLEGNLKEVQSTYARTMGWPLRHKESLLVEAEEEQSAPWIFEKSRFWPEQFASIDLSTAKDLHAGYQKELDHLESHIDRLEFLLPKMRDETFELNAVITLAQDEVLANLARKASQLALSLREEGNYSQKDLHRMGDALKSQKKFIEAHLQQTVGLYRKQANILQHKLASLRGVMLKLIDSEKIVIQEQIHHFQQMLSTVPERWRFEKLLEAKSETMQKVVEGMSQVIEGKIVEHHLKNFNSKLVDPARPPQSPDHLSLLKMVVLFSILGAIIGYFILFFRTLSKGFPLSVSSAFAYGLPSAGKLSSYSSCAFEELPQYDLETMRKIVDFVEKHAQIIGCTTISIVGKHQQGWCDHLAELFSRQGKTVLIADLSFPQRIPAHASKGLLQYLQGQIEELPIIKFGQFDKLFSGGTTRYVTELLRGDRFDRFLEEAGQRYERILLLSETPLDATETHLLLKKGDLGIVLIGEESYETLVKSGIAEMAMKENKATLVFEQE